jgi:signal transduction histidine kinase/CheY-like chemotaxis protein/HPt (histidine-containing phosphotransfer) domain-containing protein
MTHATLERIGNALRAGRTHLKQMTAPRLWSLLPQLGARQEQEAVARQYTALRDLISNAEFKSGDIQKILVRAADACCHGLDADRVSIWLRDSTGRLLEMQALSQRNEDLSTRGMKLPLDDSRELFSALGAAQVIATNDAQQAPHLKELFEKHPGLKNTKSRIDVPLMIEGNIAGLLIVSMSSHRVDWSLQQIQFAREIGKFASLTVDRRERVAFESQLVAMNTRLVAEVERREDREKTIKVRQTALAELIKTSGDANTDVPVVLQHLADTIRTHLDVDRVSVWLGSELRNDCTVVASSDKGAPLIATGQSFPFPNVPTYLTAMEKGEALATENVRTAPHLAEMVALFPSIALVKSRIDIPVLRDGKAIGMMIAVTTEAHRNWSAEDVMFSSAIAGVTAILLERQQRQQVEQDLRRAHAEVEAANKAKSLFLANMSHEIRTPMNGVFGMTDLLLRTHLTERQSRFVSTINQSARTLLTIINDILDLSRIEAGKFELDSHAFDVQDTIEGAVEVFVEDAQRKGLDLSLYVAPDVPRSVIGDAGRLRQICINLIGNAVKFTKEGEIAVRVTTDGKGGPKPKLIFEVRDTGIGIPPEIQARLFQPFAQADSSISRRFGGTGLGLSISMHLAEMMGGRVLLSSSVGEGTTIHLDVALARAATEQTPSIAPELAGARILVVDDRETNREIVVNYLSTDGAHCTTACDAAEAEAAVALAHAEGRPFAVLVVDMIMPGADGLELVQRLRNDQRNAALGIVMVTSLSWKGDQRSVRGLGVHEFLTKPVRRSDLTRSTLRALTAATREVAQEAEGSTTHPSEASKFTAHVLVAEDNPVNVEVACEYLQLLGVTFDVAADGNEAIALCQKGHYDLVLMDCQMPDLDGLEATRRMRAHELQRGVRRTPIIAVTANAYDSDRVACLDAGMDDYISKPFSDAQLTACLATWLTAECRGIEQPVPKAELEAALNTTFVNALKSERPQLFAKITKAYLAHSPRLISELTEAASAGNIAALRSAAHSLKSSSANIGADRMSELCKALEAVGETRDGSKAIVLVRDVVSEFRAVGIALARATG